MEVNGQQDQHHEALSLAAVLLDGTNLTPGWKGLCGTSWGHTFQPASMSCVIRTSFKRRESSTTSLEMELKLPEAEEQVLINSVINNSSAFHQESNLLKMVIDHRSLANRNRQVQTILDIRAGKVEGKSTEKVKGMDVEASEEGKRCCC